jgi:hypothetical protein
MPDWMRRRGTPRSAARVSDVANLLENGGTKIHLVLSDRLRALPMGSRTFEPDLMVEN